ncbi:hypothetical protein R3P38DRAFT_2527211 [Favolaschia claudopus]|uniref:Gag protein n=1 Tax=Favolaschia claudopus TaxID=2862362 RepID=A0AAW0BL46_9AGAR
MSTIPPFTGSRGTDKVSAADFLKDARIYYRERGITDQAEKLVDIGDRFRGGSPAEEWFKALKPTVWADFEKEFTARFGRAPPAAKPRPQLLAEIAGMRIAAEELVKDGLVIDGEVVRPLTAFTERVQDAVVAAGAGADTDGVWAFHSALPGALRTSIGAVPSTWSDMVTAMRAVPSAVVDAVVDQYKQEDQRRALEQKVDLLARQFSNARIGPLPAPQPVQARAAAAPANVNANAGAMGGGGAGASGGARRGREGTEAEKAVLTRVMTTVMGRRAPDTEEGRRSYAADVATWNRVHAGIPHENIAIHTTGYPLRPGTSNPCTNECWQCGMVTAPPHRKDACTVPPVPLLERRFRTVCAMWLGRARNVPGVGMNFVGREEVEGAAWWNDAEGTGNAPDAGQGF